MREFSLSTPNALSPMWRRTLKHGLALLAVAAVLIVFPLFAEILFYCGFGFLLFGAGRPGHILADFLQINEPTYLEIIILSALPYGFLIALLTWFARKCSRRVLSSVVIGLVYMVFVCACALIRIYWLGLPFRTEHSPYERSSLTYYKIPMLMCMPGGGSDFSGYIRLKNSWGYPLATAYFSMYHGVRTDQLVWTPSGVEMPDLFQWDYDGHGRTRYDVGDGNAQTIIH